MKDLQHGDLGSSWLHYPEIWFYKSFHFFFLSLLFNKILIIKCLKKIILVNLKFSNNSVYTGQGELIPNMNFTHVRQKLFTNNNHQIYLKHYRKDIFKRILFYKWQPNCRTNDLCSFVWQESQHKRKIRLHKSTRNFFKVIFNRFEFLLWLSDIAGHICL